MMQVPCKNIAQASLKNTIYLDKLVSDFQNEMMTASNKMIEEEFSEHTEEIGLFNTELEQIIKTFQNPQGGISDREGYKKAIDECGSKFPTANAFQVKNKEMMLAMMKSEVELTLALVPIGDVHPAITGNDLNISDLIIDMSKI